ncbi:MAG: hypothetical protein IPO98_20550 [Saprospiraceae bacterium]|nr:hypothetical protein [Saprospiraceae bacterium]
MKPINLSKVHIIIMILIIFGCTKNKEDDKRYLIFGHSYGKCTGKICLEIFKLTPDQLYEDVDDNFFNGNLRFTLLPQTKFDLAAYLLNAYPKELTDELNKSYGCPDCHDQGTIILQYYDGNRLKSFLVDQDKTAIPNYLHGYVDSINETIRLLNL